MEPQRHKTQKKTFFDLNEKSEKEENFKTLLEDSAREAYSRPWHRLERGLRLNRIRIYIEDIAPQYNMTKDEKDAFFIYLQKALDKKLLNTLKVVQYEQDTQRIHTIKGLEIKRNSEGVLRWGFSSKKQRTDVTRKKRKDENTNDNNQIKIDGEINE
jgi:mannose-6-phosphate isomerase class I